MLPLLGLDTVLGDERCERVELSGPAAAPLAFVREGEDAWAPADGSGDAVHTRELRRTIDRGLGRTFDRLVCHLAEEQVEYVAERDGVRVERAPRAATAAEAEADLAAVAEALGIPRSRRGHKLIQARRFARLVEAAVARSGLRDRRRLRVLDLACGRSYLGFALAHLLGARGRDVALHGVDSDPDRVESSRRTAAALGWSGGTFEVAELAAYSIEPGAFDIVVLLHGCDTLTDEAIRIACTARTPLVFVAPCCQHELRHQLGRHPLDWVGRFGLLEQRLADVLTDAFRCLVMQALGYRVRVLRFVEPDASPKNLLIQGLLASGPRPDRAREARAFLQQFGVRPRLAELLDEEP